MSKPISKNLQKELLSDQGYRTDGRKSNELRRIHGNMGTIVGVDGSAYLEQGNSKVLVIVHGPHEVRGYTKGNTTEDGECAIRVYWKVARFSHSERKQRSSVTERISKDWEFAVQDCIKGIIIGNLLRHLQIDIHIHVLQYDGGASSCAINAVTLALIDAGIPMHDFLISCHGILYNEEIALIDSSLIEEMSLFPLITIVVHARANQVTFIQMNNSQLPFNKASYFIKSVQLGAQSIYLKLKDIVEHNNSTLYAARQLSIT